MTEFKASHTLENTYPIYQGMPTKNWANARITNYCGIFINLGRNGESLKELTGFKTVEEYDEFVSTSPKHIKNCLMQYDVQILEPNGCKVSYPFEMFRKMLFPEQYEQAVN